MKSTWRRSCFLATCLLLVAAIGTVAYIREQEVSRQKLDADLSNAISQNKSGTISYIDFSKITAFDWDRMYTFGPYMSPETMDKTLGTFWPVSRLLFLSKYETLIVFTKDGWVVNYLIYPNDPGNFSGTFKQAGYSFQEARFAIDKYGEMIWVTDK
jgi:hypothetical protein